MIIVTIPMIIHVTAQVLTTGLVIPPGEGEPPAVASWIDNCDCLRLLPKSLTANLWIDCRHYSIKSSVTWYTPSKLRQSTKRLTTGAIQYKMRFMKYCIRLCRRDLSMSFTPYSSLHFVGVSLYLGLRCCFLCRFCHNFIICLLFHFAKIIQKQKTPHGTEI